MKKPAKGKLKYQSIFPHCLDKKMNNKAMLSYVRAKSASTAYGSIPKDETVLYQWDTFKKTGKTNLFSSKHEHKYYENSKRQRAVQLTKYQVWSLVENFDGATRTEVKEFVGSNNEKRQIAINQLLEEGFLYQEGRTLKASDV